MPERLIILREAKLTLAAFATGARSPLRAKASFLSRQITPCSRNAASLSGAYPSH